MANNKEDWWLVDSEGRKIGWMWPEDLEAIMQSFYGKRWWIKDFAEDFGIHRATVDRWRKGVTPIPKHMAHLISMMSALKMQGKKLPEISAEWLPEAEGSKAKKTANAVNA